MGLSGRVGNGRKVHEEIVAETSPNLMKNQCNLFYLRLDYKINTKRWALRHSMEKLLETKNREKP